MAVREHKKRAIEQKTDSDKVNDAGGWTD